MRAANHSRLNAIGVRGTADSTKFARLDFWEDYHAGQWNNRSGHEWFLDVEESLDLLMPNIKMVCARSIDASSLSFGCASCVLNIGCGTSALGVELAKTDIAAVAGLHVTNLDYSPVAISAMKALYPEDGEHRNEWIVADALHMPFEASKFDLVLDKGTFDAFECGDVGLSKDATPTTELLCLEVDRVLKRHSKATWLQITHSAPELRIELLLSSLPRARASLGSVREMWSITHQSLGEDENGFEYFMYAIRRRMHFAVFGVDRQGTQVQLDEFIDESEAHAAVAKMREHKHFETYTEYRVSNLAAKL